MKEHPILFKSEMVRAILEGRKTQTRRIISPQPNTEIMNVESIGYTAFTPKGSIAIRGTRADGRYAENWVKEKYKVGDHLWVKETFCNCGDLAWSEEICTEDRKNTIGYKADYSTRLYNCDDKLVELETTAWNWGHEKIKWKPSIFMKRIYSRLLLEITNIRVERLNKISEKDAEAEGCISTAVLTEDKQDYTGLYASEHFARLWEKINGEGLWRSNPFVWVIEFRRIK